MENWIWLPESTYPQDQTNKFDALSDAVNDHFCVAEFARKFDFSRCVPSCLFVGGDITCAQASRAVPGIVTVVTKHEISRNEATFRDNEELFADIKANVAEAIQANIPTYSLTYPAVMEKSFKRVEDAAKYLEKILALGIEADYLDDEILGKDAHTVQSTVYRIEDFIRCF